MTAPTSSHDAHVVPHAQMLEMVELLEKLQRKLVSVSRSVNDDEQSINVPLTPAWLENAGTSIQQLRAQYAPPVEEPPYQGIGAQGAQGGYGLLTTQQASILNTQLTNSEMSTALEKRIAQLEQAALQSGFIQDPWAAVTLQGQTGGSDENSTE